MNDFIDFLNNLFGSYTPVVDSNGVIPAGMAGVDFPYVLRGILFVIIAPNNLKTL